MRKWHWIALIVIIVISFAAQFFKTDKDAAWYDKLPAFWGVYGFVGCVVIILVSKAVGKYFLQRKEDYYDEP